MENPLGRNLVLAGIVVILVGAFLAYLDGMLFQSQLLKKYPGGGYSYSVNGGPLGIVIILPVLFLIGMYDDQWSSIQKSVMLIVGIAVFYALFHLVYLKGNMPDSLAGGGRPISLAGWVILLYSGVALATILLFYVCSKATPTDVLWVGGLCALYLIVANHVLLYYLKNHYHLAYFAGVPRIFVDEMTPVIIMGCVGSLLGMATLIKYLFPNPWWR